MSTVALEEAQAKLPELIAPLTPDEEMIITRHQQLVARLVRTQHAVRQPRQLGSAQGTLVILVEDEAHLKDFTDYMP